jgi:selenocysteine-specific elongation factor
MRHVIAGTAGHIDHGKTTLVKALTGIDTDRLEEEKRRGISIDLGFAHLDLTPALRIGFVDVPGHERFVKNMLAGAAGVDLVLLVIAADESIKPQTREHFDICRLLGIRHGVVAITKSDLVHADALDLVRLEIEDFIAGSFLEGAPVVPLSATSGAGLDDLRAALEQVAASVPEKDAARHPRLPIDRSFSMKGHGAVVTGTLMSGAIHLRDELELYPAGKRVRVRGLQVHSSLVERAQAGERTAVNLAGIDAPEACRGMVLAPPATFGATRQADCAVELLSSAPPLKDRAPVHFHAGTAVVEAEVRHLSPPGPLRPGSRAHVRFLLAEPLLLLPGDRFIIRRFSPVVTIGGGVVIDIAAPPRLRRVDLAARLAKLAAASAADRVALLVCESAFGMSVNELVARTGLLPGEIRGIAQSGPFVYLPDPQDWLVSRGCSEQIVASFRQNLSEFHRSNPLQPGMQKEQLRSSQLAGAPPFLLDALLARAGDIASDGELVRLKSHRVAIRQDEQRAIDRMETLFRQAGLAVPPTAEVLANSGIEPGRARQLLQLLLRDRKLVRVSTELVFHQAVLDELRQTLAARKGQRFSVSDFKDWTGLSRKYAIPLLEFLDRERITRREGDHRVVS